MGLYQKLNLTIFIGTLFFLDGCETKREALGSDNEIRVICSELDKEDIRKFLTSIFTDTIFTPEPEPLYYLKFSGPETYNNLKTQAQVVVAAVARDPGNSGYQLVKKLLPADQFANTESADPVILSKDVNALKQLFMVINAGSEEQLMGTVKSKKNFIYGVSNNTNLYFWIIIS